MEVMSLAQQRLANSLISWKLISARLREFPAIGKAFPERLLHEFDDKPPFCAHYMAWRLGTWKGKAHFERLNALLEHAANLPGWSSERSLLRSAEYGDYWSLVWQLQVAEYLSSVGSDVLWLGAGPDLQVNVQDSRVFVECLCYRKYYALELFLEDVTQVLGPDIRTERPSFLPLVLNDGKAREPLISRALEPFLDTSLMAAKREEARLHWPVEVSSAGPISFYLEGPSDSEYVPSLANAHGDVVRFMTEVLADAVKKKGSANDLQSHRPNLLAINLLLANETSIVDPANVPLTDPLPNSLDGVAVVTLGIDAALSRPRLRLLRSRMPDHPAKAFTS